MAQKNYFEVLGVPQDASAELIKKRHREMALKHHPDRGGDHEFFIAIQQAYDTLNDPNKKRAYMANLLLKQQGSSSQCRFNPHTGQMEYYRTAHATPNYADYDATVQQQMKNLGLEFEKNVLKTMNQCHMFISAMIIISMIAGNFFPVFKLVSAILSIILIILWVLMLMLIKIGKHDNVSR